MGLGSSLFSSCVVQSRFTRFSYIQLTTPAYSVKSYVASEVSNRPQKIIHDGVDERQHYIKRVKVRSIELADDTSLTKNPLMKFV